MKLYYYENSERKGPIASVRLRELARNGEITPDTIVENEFGNKTEASKIGSLITGLSLEKEFSTSASTPDAAPPEIASVEAEKEPARPESTPEPTPTTAPEFVPPKIDDPSIDLQTSDALDLDATVPAAPDPYKYVSRAEPMKIDVPEVVRAGSPKESAPEPTKKPEPAKEEPPKTRERAKTEPSKKPDDASKAPSKTRRIDPAKDPFEETNEELREEIRRRREEFSKPAQRANIQSAAPQRQEKKEETPVFRATTPQKNVPPTPGTPAQAQKGGSSCLFWIVVFMICMPLLDVFEAHPGFFIFFVSVVATVWFVRKQINAAKKP